MSFWQRCKAWALGALKFVADVIEDLDFDGDDWSPDS